MDPTEMHKTSSETKDSSMRISLLEKIAYGLGDAASNVVWSAAAAFLVYYYTNVVGIAAGVAGTIMLVSRIFDGISDIIMGGIVDRTKSKFGKARPWLLWMAGPFALAAFLLFAVPQDWSNTGKVVYAFLTYNFMSTIVYTAINLPYGVMNAMMTDNLKDRAQLNIFRMVGALLMMMLSNMIVIPLVKFFGNGDQANPAAWTITFTMLGVIGACLFLLCFLGTKERISTQPKSKEEGSVLKALPSLFKNKYWVICLLTGFIAQTTTGLLGVNPFFAQYFLGDVELTGTLNLIMMGPLLLGLLILGPIIHKLGKRNAIMYGSIVSLVGFGIQLLNPYSFNMVAIGGAIKGLCMAPSFASGFAMLADVIDYHEWKTGQRSEGIVYSAASFGAKVGAGLGVGVLGWALEIGKFQESMPVQPPSAMNAILWVYIYIPLILQVVNILLYSQYSLDKIYPQIIKELKQRKGDSTSL